MPKIGEIRRRKDVLTKRGNGQVVWASCQKCSKERWVSVIKGGLPISKICLDCALKARHRGNENWKWKGGKYTDKTSGYIMVRLQPDDFFYPMMAKSGYILEHRLVMARHLNRCLLEWETVHHRGIEYPIGSDENKQDNRIENLELFPSATKHDALSRMRKYIKKLEREVEILRRQNEAH